MSYNSPFTGNVIQPTDVSFREFTISVNTALEWPINGSTSSDITARIMEVTATVAGLDLAMPPANQNSVGNDALIRNIGAETFTVTDFDGGTITAIAAGEAKYIYITTNPDTAGTWGVIDYGVGASSPDASALQGLGVLAISSSLNQSHPVSSFTDGYSFIASDRSQTKVWGGGAGDAYLPSSVAIGNNWFFLLKNNGSGTLTINCTGADNIDGGSTKDFQPDESAIIVSTGSAYVTIGYGVSNNFAFTSLVKPVVNGAYTLTASEAGNTIQQYVGTLTGNVTVTYPAAVNLYVVSNQTVDNGYTLTLTTGVIGGGNASVAVNEQATLICDGTNFLNANTTQAGATSISLINGTAATPSLNFSSETNTGIFLAGANQFGISVDGSQIAALTPTGLGITGSGNFTGGVLGGTF
jgi:hypothetical protein